MCVKGQEVTRHNNLWAATALHKAALGQFSIIGNNEAAFASNCFNCLQEECVPPPRESLSIDQELIWSFALFSMQNHQLQHSYCHQGWKQIIYSSTVDENQWRKLYFLALTKYTSWGF